MQQWAITGRFVVDGTAIIEAETEEEAQKKADNGDFEFEHATCSFIEWPVGITKT